MNREWKRLISTTCNKQKQEFKWLNGKRTQTRRRPFYTPKPDADLCMRLDLLLDKKLWKIRTGPPGRQAMGCGARRPSWAAGRWTFRLPGCRAVGVVLAKPIGFQPFLLLFIFRRLWNTNKKSLFETTNIGRRNTEICSGSIGEMMASHRSHLYPSWLKI